MNLKNVSLLQSEELRRKTTQAEKEKLLEEKEYERNLQHLQAQLQMAKEQKKSLDPVGVKKRLKDYEQMLQYCTLMKTKNKMTDYEVEFEEWWEIVEEYFTNELEKNIDQHKSDERIQRYKLEVHKKKFQILFMAVQQVQRWARIGRLKHNLVE